RDHAVAPARGPGAAGRALYREGVGLGAATGEHHFGRAGTPGLRDLLTGGLERGLWRRRRRMPTDRVPEGAAQERLHRRDGLRPHRSGRGMVQIRGRRIHGLEVYGTTSGREPGIPASSGVRPSARPSPRITVTPPGDT